jgi:hypothetical protein
VRRRKGKMGEIADSLIQRGEDEYLQHIAGDCMEDCSYCYSELADDDDNAEERERERAINGAIEQEIEEGR